MDTHNTLGMKKSTESKGSVYIHKQIIEKCKEGDHSAQRKLYELYSKAMFNVCCRMMNSREEAEDMLQDVFVDAFLNLDSFRYESSFGTWLKRNVINKCLNEINRRKPELMYCDDMTFYMKEEITSEEYAQGLTIANVKEAMELLPRGSKLIFSLYLLEGYDHQEIAQILNISVSNSKTQLLRAKKKVKKALRAMMKNEEGVYTRQLDHSFQTYCTSSIPSRNLSLMAI